MAAQCPPDISGYRIGGYLRKPEHVGRANDVDLAPDEQVPTPRSGPVCAFLTAAAFAMR